MTKKRLGDVLVEQGALVHDDLERALSIQRQKNARLGEVLMHNLRMPRMEVAKAIEQVQGVTYVDCPPENISPEILALIPRATAMKCCALPLEIRNNALVVAVAEPQDFKILEELRFRAGKAISARFSFKDDIIAAIRKFYDHEDLPPRELVLKELVVKEPEPPKEEHLQTDSDEEKTLTELEFVIAAAREETRDAVKEFRAGVKKQGAAVRFICMILARAARKDATDLHIEPQVSGITVRMRIDGVLRELMKMPSEHQVGIIGRIKALADMDAVDQRLPQEGRFLMIYMGRKLDVRVSTLPTYFGEKIMMRILDPRSTLFSFEQLGMPRAHQESIRRLMTLPQGMVMVTGPQGAGKTTSLYAALNLAASSRRDTVTIEDPVENIIDGVTQVQVDARAGLTMAAALRPILRQNPNVVVIGEIRDAETAEIALRASQTGHLVLATMQANDSVGAISRLREMGIASNLITSIGGVIGQRLLRTLCVCQKKVPAAPDYVQALEAIGAKQPPTEMRQPEGCPACDHSGYKGRTGIFEALTVNGMIRDAIHADADSDAIRTLLRSGGFSRMQEDALDKINQGVTTLDEVMRIVPIDSTLDRHCGQCGHRQTPGFRFCPFCGVSIL